MFPFYKVKFATIQWDEKLLLDLTGNEKVERLAVVLSQESGFQLLGVPKIENSTGEAMAQKVYSTLVDYNAINDVVAMSFDTTNSNSGYMRGAGVLLERKLGRNLLKLACRHHIYEVMLRAVFELKFGKTTAPAVPMFQQFRDGWSQFDQKKFIPGIRDEKIANILKNDKNDIIQFCKNELKNAQPRADYKEFLELTLVFLGEHVDNFKFRTPGPMHHARWMAKAIYSLKSFMFASQFQPAKEQINALRDVCLFIVKLYVKVWFQCTKASRAPKLDLQFLKDIHAYQSIDKQTSDTILNKFRTQAWYLSEEPIALAFFDDNVTIEEKRNMVRAFNEQPEPNEETRMFKFIFTPSQIHRINEWHLSDFITENTKDFFSRYNISIDFLELDPSKWHSDAEYQRAQKMLKTLQVVNDHSERALNMMQRFNRLVTRDEEEEQYILQIISEHQKESKGISKSALTREEEN